MKNYLDVNVILTFSSPDAYGDYQEFFDLKLPINKNENDAHSFLNHKLFKRIASKCNQYGRKKEQLYKISTASNWKFFEKVTGKPSIATLGHNCKWYFNDDINNLDAWEEQLKQSYQFGTELNFN
jgi:hypothetical protein